MHFGSVTQYTQSHHPSEASIETEATVKIIRSTSEFPTDGVVLLSRNEWTYLQELIASNVDKAVLLTDKHKFIRNLVEKKDEDK